MRSGWATKQNEFVDPPIQFSHAHRVHAQFWNDAPILEPVRERGCATADMTCRQAQRPEPLPPISR
jgi:hypothetical protein